MNVSIADQSLIGFHNMLQGNALATLAAPPFIAYGSKITLRHMDYGLGLLHSHPDRYPDSYLGQQQVTTYGHKDSNNDWMVLPVNGVKTNLSEPAFVRSGDRVMLVHCNTQKALQRQQFPAFISLSFGVST